MTSSATDNPASALGRGACSKEENPRVVDRLASGQVANWFVQREQLLAVLREPQRLVELSLAEWDLLVRLARQTGMLPRLATELRARQEWEQLPAMVRPTLQSSLVLADRHECVVRWEFGRLEFALREVEGPIVLLKGAAYLAAGIPVSQGRIYSDVDLLVPHAQLPLVETKLLAHGWRTGELDPRDANYFRTWLHELPPLVHRRRRTVLDVHHTILPRTDKLQVDPAQLLAASIEVPGRRLRVLAPADMILHSAAHLFRNGDFSHAVRDLYDLDGLVRNFSSQSGFWKTLVERAELHNLQLPCYCGLRYAKKYYQTPVDKIAAQAIERWRPASWQLTILDRLVDRALVPRELDRTDRGRERALNLLAHWPVPRWQAMFTANFWAKRLPRWGETASNRAVRQSLANRETTLQTYSQAASRAPEKPD